MQRDANGRWVSGGKMDAEMRKKISESQLKRHAKARQAQGPPSEVKKCSGPCGKVLPIKGNFTLVRRVLKSGVVTWYPQGKCHACKRVDKAKWRNKNREHIRELNRKAHLKRYSTPDRRELYRRQQREGWRIRYGRGGALWKKYRHEAEGRLPLVDPQPFLVWLDSLNGSTPTEAEMGAALTRAIRRLRQGEHKRVGLDIVDQMGVLVGQPHLVHALYPPV